MTATAVAVCVLGGAAIAAAPAHGQSDLFGQNERTARITGDRLSGHVLPIEPLTGNVELHSLRASTWRVDDTTRLYLEQDAVVQIGPYRVEADNAVIWINRIPSASGEIIQIAAYFDHVRNSTSRAGIGMFGDDVLVTGSARGRVKMNVALLDRRRDSGHGLVAKAEQRLAAHLARLRTDPPALTGAPQFERPEPKKTYVPRPGVEPPDVLQADDVELPPLASPVPGLVEPSGRVRFSAEHIEVASGEVENTIACTGGLHVEYIGEDPTAKWSRLTLTAQRAVIYTEPGPLSEMAQREFDASQVRGVYLEGNVTVMADDGRYSVRAPRIYYDFVTGQAVMVNAVLRTYSRDIDRPVYARAREMRQVAANQWQANQVRVSTSEFAVPHVSFGAEQLTITQRPSDADPDQDQTHVESRHNTLRLGDVPIAYWPKLSGSLHRPVLRSATVGSGNNAGVRIETKWDLFSLLGRPTPEGVDGQLSLNGYTSRGLGAGLAFDYEQGETAGRVEFFGQYDDGIDLTSAGREVRKSQELRGLGLWEHRSRLSRFWTIQAQASAISDPTYISAWRPEEFQTRRPYETSVYLKRQDERSVFSILGQYDLNNFISTSDLLSSRGYQVDRLPDVGYYRFGDSWFDDSVTYSGSLRATHMRLVLSPETPNSYGVPGAVFGIADTTVVGDALRAAGYPDTFVNRFDTRHEVSVPMQIGQVQITPFAVGRFTAWDNDFEDFSSDGDDFRFFGGGGVRLATQIQHVDNSVENALFDLHRIRHIIEPSVTLWYGYSTVPQTALPVYDESVESIGDGSAVRLGVRNTWQTKRGGPGRWRSVDVFVLNADVVLNSGDVDTESSTPQFFDYRPEYSQFGDHFAASALWQVSDSLLVLGSSIVNTDDAVLARGSLGLRIAHDPMLSTHVEYRYLDASDTRLLGVGWRYDISPKYNIWFTPQWDFASSSFRRVVGRVTRRFPDFNVVVSVQHDDIQGETTVGASIDLATF